jgi:hypothetical protein
MSPDVKSAAKVIAIILMSLAAFGFVLVQLVTSGLISAPLASVLADLAGIGIIFYAVFRFFGNIAGYVLCALMALWTLNYLHILNF